MKIDILYEDKDFLVINKPAGISVHGDGKSKEKTLSDWIIKKIPSIKNVGEPGMYEGKVILRPGVVHRLDKGTSGVLLFAKNQKSYEFIKSQFQERNVRKIYNTIVHGWVKEDRGVITKPIGRSPSDFRKRLAGRGARGELRDAVTEYRVLKRFEEKGNKYTHLEIRPKTGRTHQIRVHMKFFNHPVVCDSLYWPNKPHPKGVDSLALHARSLEFMSPKGGVVKVECPLPDNFSIFL